MTSKILDYAFPVVGGAGGGVCGIFTVITWTHIWEWIVIAAITAAVGAVIGFLVKRLMDILFKQRKI